MFYTTTSSHFVVCLPAQSVGRWESDWRQAGQKERPKMILHPENNLLLYCVDREVFTSALCCEMLKRQNEVRRKISKRSNKANKIKISLKDLLNNNLLSRKICIWLLCDIKSFPIAVGFFLQIWDLLVP